MNWSPAVLCQEPLPFPPQGAGTGSNQAWLIPANPTLSLQQGEGSIDSAGSRDGKFTPVRQALPGRGANKALQDLNLVNLGDMAVRIVARGQERFVGCPQEREMGVA